MHRAKFCGEPGPVDRLLVRSDRFFIGEDFLFPGLEFFFVDGGGVKLLPYFVDLSGELVFASDVSGFFVKVVERNATVSGFVDAGLDEVVEEGGEGVIVFGGDRIVFVIVAFGAAGGGAHPDCAKGADVLALECIESFFFNDAGFAIRIDDAVVGGSGEGAIISIGKKIPGELLAGELIKGHVVSEGLDDVFSVRRGGDGFVGNHAVGVGVTNEIEPEKPLVLGVLERGEPSIDELFVVFRRGIFFEGGDFFGRGRKSAKVVGKSTKKNARGGFFDGLDFLLVPSAFKEGIDRVFGESWDFGAGEFLIGPMFFVFRTFLDPLFERVLLLSRQAISRVEGRHVIIFIVGEDPVDQFALFGLARNDGRGFSTGSSLEGVETKAGFAFFLIEAVTEKAVLREDGTDVAVVADLSSSGERQGEEN